MKFPHLYSHRLCRLCQRYRAKFTFMGHVKRDKDHDICHRCYRSLRDMNRASTLLGTHLCMLLPYEGTSFFRQALGRPALNISTKVLEPRLGFHGKEQRKCH